MTSALVASVVVLWVAVLVLAAVVFALARQIGVLYERVAPAGALVIGKGPVVGEESPVVRVLRLDGATEMLGGASPDGRSTLVFFLSPTCPVCKALLPSLRSIARAESSWLRVVLASDGPRDEHASFVARERLGDFPYVLSAQLGLTHQVSKLPYAILLDGAGVLRARGLVNTREHLESLFEASEQGVATIQELLRRERETVKVA
ncbi:MAG TPA: methylamine dehydrogenase accessory protein MauD [Candidatus Limnocylindrales bacterium]|nr:methylamine dehydrogenase accessory protein MauD [Candidatus Limnocylindrales bacterium]